MKSIKILAAVCIAFLLFSCSEDDPIGVNATADEIAGTWRLVEITQEGTTTTEIQGVPIQTNFTAVGKNIDAQVVFTQNPNNFVGSGSYTSVVMVSILGQGNTQEIPVDIDEFLSEGTWAINNTELMITQNNESATAIITEITTSTLKFEIEINQEITIDGFTSTSETTAKMSLVKQ